MDPISAVLHQGHAHLCALVKRLTSQPTPVFTSYLHPQNTGFSGVFGATHSPFCLGVYIRWSDPTGCPLALCSVASLRDPYRGGPTQFLSEVSGIRNKRAQCSAKPQVAKWATQNRMTHTPQLLSLSFFFRLFVCFTLTLQGQGSACARTHTRLSHSLSVGVVRLCAVCGCLSPL